MESCVAGQRKEEEEAGAGNKEESLRSFGPSWSIGISALLDIVENVSRVRETLKESLSILAEYVWLLRVVTVVVVVVVVRQRFTLSTEQNVAARKRRVAINVLWLGGAPS